MVWVTKSVQSTESNEDLRMVLMVGGDGYDASRCEYTEYLLCKIEDFIVKDW